MSKSCVILAFYKLPYTERRERERERERGGGVAKGMVLACSLFKINYEKQKFKTDWGKRVVRMISQKLIHLQ